MGLQLGIFSRWQTELSHLSHLIVFEAAALRPFPACRLRWNAATILSQNFPCLRLQADVECSNKPS